MEKEPIACCLDNELHEANIALAKNNLPDEEQIYDAAELFKVFGDSTRMKILYLLLESELCVCDIVALLGATQSAVSHQLRILKQSRLVRFRKQGRSVFYSLADEHVCKILDNGMEHIKE